LGGRDRGGEGGGKKRRVGTQTEKRETRRRKEKSDSIKVSRKGLIIVEGKEEGREVNNELGGKKHKIEGRSNRS